MYMQLQLGIVSNKLVSKRITLNNNTELWIDIYINIIYHALQIFLGVLSKTCIIYIYMHAIAIGHRFEQARFQQDNT